MRVGDLVRPAWGGWDGSPYYWAEVLGTADWAGSPCLRLRRCRDNFMVFGGRPEEWALAVPAAEWRARVPDPGDIVEREEHAGGGGRKRWASVFAVRDGMLLLRYLADSDRGRGWDFRDHPVNWRVAKTAAERVAEALMAAEVA